MDDTDHALFPRFSGELVATALKDTPVVMVTGLVSAARQTLVRDLVSGKREFITMDDDTVLAAARSDPTGLVRALDRTTIDEVQRVPDLLRAIKRSVDEDRRAGRFLLTGSANILTLPQVSESLAARMEVVSLLPLSRAEIRGKKPGFLKAAFDSRVSRRIENTAPRQFHDPENRKQTPSVFRVNFQKAAALLNHYPDKAEMHL
ncbi:MAG: AAA family ATPase [Candidatus Sulfotelmatobacter sp.]